MEYNIKVNTEKKEIMVQAKEGIDYLSLLRKHEIPITSDCAGKGTCGKCMIKFLQPQDPGLTAEEEKLIPKNMINSGYRLACKQQVQEDSIIFLTGQGEIKSVVEGIEVDYNLFPVCSRYSIDTNKISSNSNKKGIADELLDLIGLQSIHSKALNDLGNLYGNVSRITLITHHKELLNISRKNNIKHLFGLAVDAGTTTLVIYLLDLINGNTVDYISLTNPQKEFGADVISRIQFANEIKDGNEKLQATLLQTLNQAIKNLCKVNSITADNIYNATICGNPFILHSLLGISSQTIGSYPYRPLFTSTQIITAKQLSLNINNRGRIIFMPGLTGNVGSDLTAGLLTIESLSSFSKLNLLLDIGTNGEVILTAKNKIYCCATAAGPALEGGNITCGIAGVPGAIAGVTEEKSNIILNTIDDKQPAGICGSGIIDLIAYLLDKEVVDQTGKISEDKKNNRIFTYKNQKAYFLHKDKNIFLTQQDIRQIQLAKGALRTGIEILLKEANIAINDLDNIFLAGGFGSHLKKKSICRLGILPQGIENKIVKLGNSAGTGARLYLLDGNARKKAENYRENSTYISLAEREDFQNDFVNNMKFPKNRR
ncbi:MAG: ASKHA domain-containing protein [Halanaerobiales bacterium]